MLLFLLSSTLVAAVIIFIYKSWSVNQTWKNQGIPHVKPVLFFGNMLDLVLKRRTQAEIIRDIHNAFPKESFVGYYHFMSPRLVIRDVQLVERILIKDFQHFVDRAAARDIKNQPLTVNLFVLTGNLWRAIRGKFSPMFTTGKLRHMLPDISNIADRLTGYLDQKTEATNIKDEASKFAMEVIASCAFGFDAKTLGDEENEFRRQARLAFKPSFVDIMRVTLVISFPRLAQFLGLNFNRMRTTNYFSSVIRSALTRRKETKEVRKDFIQLMVTLQEKGVVEIEKEDPTDDYLKMDYVPAESSDTKLELTDDFMIGQAFVFLVAGFEATATAIASMCMYLALNPEAQEKARQEIKKVLASTGELTYDSLRQMTYLDGCLKETLRLQPPVGNLIRMCVKPYKIPGSSYRMVPGDNLMISPLAIHYDPEVHPEPEKFLPERWDPTEGLQMPPCSYLPFGDGPRICIGMRFATTEVKCCLVKMLQKYNLKPHSSLKLPIKMNPYSFFSVPLKPVLFNLEKLSS